MSIKQQLDQIIIKDVSLLTTVVTVIESAWDFGMIIDSLLLMDVHVAAL